MPLRARSGRKTRSAVRGTARARVKPTHSRLSTTENMLRKTSGIRPYPSTDAVRYALMPLSDIKFKSAYIETEPINATP